MKKLITLLLILALVIPAAAMAADRDPIIGSWYMFVDMAVTPEMAAAYDGADILLMMFIFNENNTISGVYFNLKNSKDDYEYSVAGKWETKGDHYYVSIIGFGTGDAYIRDGKLLISIKAVTNLDMYMKLHKLEAFDPYNDYALSIN